MPNGSNYNAREGKGRYGFHLIAFLLIILTGIVCYRPSIDGPFVYDDLRAIVQNESIRIGDLNPSSLWRAAFTGASARRPVAGLTLALNYFWGGYSTFGYHILNVLIHILNGVLVYLFAGLLLGSLGEPAQGKKEGPFRVASLMAGLFFALHPVQTQAVSYVIQRMTSLSTMFYLAAFILYIIGRDRRDGIRWLLFAGVSILWILALGSKEIAAVMPLSIMAYEWCREDSDALRHKKRLVFLTVAILSAIACVLVFFGKDPLKEIADTYRNYDFTLYERLLTQPRVVAFYISLILFPLPSRLNLDHYFETSRSLFEPWTTIPAMIFLASLLALSVFLRNRGGLYAFAILWFFIHLVIESSFIGLDMLFEHRLYMPMAGVCVAAGALLEGLSRRRRAVTVIASTVLAALLAWGTFERNRVWADEAALWKDAVTKNPSSHWARNSLGMAYLARGSISEAVNHLKAALDIKPDHTPTKINLAVALARQGKTQEASALLEMVLSANPNDFEALFNLGLLLAQEGRLDEAVVKIKKALAMRPGNAQANVIMGKILLTKGATLDAIPFIKKALRADPANSDAVALMAGVHARNGDYGKALEEYNKAIGLSPFDPLFRAAAADVLLKMGKTSDAVKYYMEALRLEPSEGLRNRIIEILKSQNRR